MFKIDVFLELYINEPSYESILGFPAVRMRPSFFCDLTQSRLVDSYRRFGTVYMSSFQGSSIPDCLTLGNRVKGLFRNVGKKLPIYAE